MELAAKQKEAALKANEMRNKADDRRAEEVMKREIAQLAAGPRQFKVPTTVPAEGTLFGGDGFIQLGDWRLGSGEDGYLVLMHNSRRDFVPASFTSNGQAQYNLAVPSVASRLWDKPLVTTGPLPNVKV